MSLASCQMKTGNSTEAAVTYEQVMALNPQDVRIYKMLGECICSSTRRMRPWLRTKSTWKNSRRTTAVAIEVAEYAYKKKDYRCRRAVLRDGCRRGNEKILFHHHVCGSVYQKKNYDKAKELYKQLALLTPQNPDIYRTLYRHLHEGQRQGRRHVLPAEIRGAEAARRPGSSRPRGVSL